MKIKKGRQKKQVYKDTSEKSYSNENDTDAKKTGVNENKSPFQIEETASKNDHLCSSYSNKVHTALVFRCFKCMNVYHSNCVVSTIEMKALTFVKRKFTCRRCLTESFHELENFLVSGLIARMVLDEVFEESNSVNLKSTFPFNIRRTAENDSTSLELCPNPHLSETSKTKSLIVG